MGRADKTAARRDHYQEATDRIVAALEDGTAPWQRPWDKAAVGRMMRPCNGGSRRAYRGINVPMLLCRGFADPRWYTFNQVSERGWTIRKGETATPVYFYKQVLIPSYQLRNKNLLAGLGADDVLFDGNDVPDAPGVETLPVSEDILGLSFDPGEISDVQWPTSEPSGANVPVLRAFPVFNAEQIVGEVPDLEEWLGLGDRTWDPNDVAEQTIVRFRESTGLGWVTGGSAAYDLRQDRVIMPPVSTFPSARHYYGTALHELGHSTMHPARLDRKVPEATFGTEEYAREELRAEMASLFMALDLGVPHDPNQHAAYVGSWIKTLKADKRELFRAARDAQAMAEYVVGHAPEYVQEAIRTRHEAPAADREKPLRPAPEEAPRVASAGATAPAPVVPDQEPDFEMGQAWA